MKTTSTRIWLAVQLLALAGFAHADLSDSRFASDCCYSQLAMNTALKAESFCREHRHPLPGADNSDLCQLEKDAAQQYSREFARASGNTGICEDDCRPPRMN